MQRKSKSKAKKSAAQQNPDHYRKDICKVLHTMLGLSASDIKIAGVTYVKAPPAGIKLPCEGKAGFYMLPRNLHCTEALYVYLVSKRGVKAYAVELTKRAETFYYYLDAESLHQYMHQIEKSKEVLDWLKFRLPKDKLDEWLREQPHKFKVYWTKQSAQIDMVDDRYPHVETDTCVQAQLIDITNENDISKLQADLEIELKKFREANDARRLRFEEIVQFLGSFKPDIQLHIIKHNIIVYDACHRQFGVEQDPVASAYSIAWCGLDKLSDDDMVIMKAEMTRHLQSVKKARPLVKLLSPYPLYTELLQGLNGQFYFYLCTSEGIFVTIRPLLQALYANFGGHNFGCMIAIDTLQENLEQMMRPFKTIVAARAESFALSYKLINRYDRKYLDKLAGYIDLHSDEHFMENIVSLPVETHHEIERELIDDETQLEKFHDCCDENTEAFIYALSKIYAGDWGSDESTIFVDKCKPPLLATMAALQVPGLHVNFAERRFQIQNIDLVKLTPAAFDNMAMQATSVYEKILLLDKIICLSATATSLANRFKTNGWEFVCDNDSKITPEVKRLWLQVGDRFEVRYDVLLREDVTVAMLKACRDEFKPKKVVLLSTQSPANDIDVKLSVSHAPAGTRGVSQTNKDRIPAKPAHKVDRAKQHKAVKEKQSNHHIPAKASLPKAFSRTRVMAQPLPVGRLPALDRYYVNPDINKMNPDQIDLTSYLAASVERVKEEKQKRVRIKNEHEGAIYHEINVLICDAAFSQQLNHMTLQDRLYQKVHYYSNWLAMVRLMNALYLRAEIIETDEKHFTQNDGKAKKLRARLIHEFPTPQCVQKLQDYLLCDTTSGKKFSDQVNLKFFSVNYIESAKKTLKEAVLEVHADLCELLKHFEENVDKIKDRRQHIADHMRARLFTQDSDYYYYEARAIQGCIMLLGELYNSVRFSEIRDTLSPELINFMAACKPIRDMASHEDAKTKTYDPIVLEEVLALARQSVLLRATQ